MREINFLNNSFKVRYRSEEIDFLPKEFFLLQFLYQNPSRIFSREELLDAVWAMEAPTDRTVDDHIYRVRKKLDPLSSVIRIETVRGQGYMLRVNKEVFESPLLNDKEVSSNVKTLFQKYHLYGHGDALRLLEENQAVFGFEVDLQSRIYLHFMKGDFMWFLETAEASFWDKCYYFLHIFSYIESDKKKCLDYFTRALIGEELPDYHRLEIKLLNRLSLLIFTKQIDEAEHLLSHSKKEIYEKKLEGFIPMISISELYLAFLREDFNNIEIMMDKMEKLLLKYPYLREKASFLIIKGIYFLTKKELTTAERYFKNGFKLYQDAKYIPGIFIGLNTILFFLKEFKLNNHVHSYYHKLWKKYAEEFNFADLNYRIKIQLDAHLK